MTSPYSTGIIEGFMVIKLDLEGSKSVLAMEWDRVRRDKKTAKKVIRYSLRSGRPIAFKPVFFPICNKQNITLFFGGIKFGTRMPGMKEDRFRGRAPRVDVG